MPARPDFVFLHDPFWGPHGVTELAHRLGAKVIAVHACETSASGVKPATHGRVVLAQPRAPLLA